MNVAYPVPEYQHCYNGMNTYYSNLLPELKKHITIDEIKIPSSNDIEMYSNWLRLQKFIPDYVDLIHNPISYAYTVGKFNVPLVMTICDAIPWTHPETFRFKSMLYHKLLGKQCLNSCDAIITISQESKDQVSKIIPEEKIHVVYPGIDQKFFEEPALSKYGIEMELGFILPYFLYVGDFGPRKNVARLIKEFVAAKQKYNWKYILILVSSSGWKDKDVWSLIEKHKRDVKVFRSVNPDQLHALYKYASLFVYPSLYEGFGLPPVEAMACGTPVLCSNTSCIPEVCGNGAEYFGPQSVDWFDSIPTEYNRKGIEIAKQYRWDKAAEQTIEVYRSVL